MTRRPFAPDEVVVLEMLCAGDWPGADIARAQLCAARYAGPSHGGGDACFEIEVIGDVPLFEQRGHAHVNELIVHDAGEVIGTIELAVTDGRLESFEYTWFGGDAPVELPRVDQLWTREESRAREERARALSHRRASLGYRIKRLFGAV
jgi:hypothetical protein